jgi:hypothetical protein
MIIHYLLGLIAFLAGLVSLFSLYWWMIHVGSVFAIHGLFGISLGLPPLPFHPVHSAINIFRDTISVVGGFIGWISLMFGFFYFHRPYSEVPRWIWRGLWIGAISILFMPIKTIFLGIFPVIASVLIFVRCKHKGNLTGTSSGQPPAAA